MKLLFPLLLTGCLSASAHNGALTVRNAAPDHTYGKNGSVLMTNVPRVATVHCESIRDCYVEIDQLCGVGNGFTVVREEWLIGKGHPQPNNHFTYDHYGLYFVLAECK